MTEACGRHAAKGPKPMIRLFFLLQATVTIAAALLCPRNSAGFVVFHGVVGAQASLIGLWLAQGTASAWVRWITTLVALAWLGLGMKLRPFFNEWEFLLLALRTAVVGGVFWGLRLRAGYRFGTAGNAGEGLPLQFRVAHLLWLTLAVALTMGSWTLIEDSALGIYVFILLLGAGFASVTLMPCWAVFGRGSPAWRLSALAAILLLIVSALSYSAYCQTGRLATALGWAGRSTTEAAFATLSLWSLRRLGYRITRRARPSIPGI